MSNKIVQPNGISGPFQRSNGSWSSLYMPDYFHSANLKSNPMSSMSTMSLPKPSSSSSGGSAVAKALSFADPTGGILTSTAEQGINTFWNWVNMKMQEAFTKRAESRANAEYDRRRNAENAYNHPLAQAQRLRQAGINPLSMLGTSVPSASPAVSLSSAPESNMPTFSEVKESSARRENLKSGADLATAQALTEQFRQDLLQEEKENKIADTIGKKLLNNFEEAVFENKVQQFKDNARLVANDLSKSDMELPFYQLQLVLGIMADSKDIELTTATIGQVYANILNINADTNVKNQYVKNLQLEFDKLDWEKQKFVLSTFFDFAKQYNNFGHEKEMLRMSQEFNASQNSKDRTNKIWQSVIRAGGGILAVIAGAVFTATGVGAGAGAGLVAGGSALIGSAPVFYESNTNI